MERPPVVVGVAAILVAYGVYAASFVPGLVVGTALPILLISTIAKAALAFVAAWGVWHERQWAASVLIMLGFVIAAAWILEGFILGLVAYLNALAVAVVAVVLTITAAAYLQRHSHQHRFH